MAKVNYVIIEPSNDHSMRLIDDLIDNKIVSSFTELGTYVLAAKGVNKRTLRKILKEEERSEY